ncbi:MAG: sulfite exporter TauE/SafE family protein, partial [Deltaproteobacteria bacterium]|nr:sulfite exporter TauE/SafE family protein [Deltaproteobacteria bacterium]
MDHLLINFWLLSLLFGMVAFLYSSVGLAGGSSYIALLTIFGASYVVIPTISLAMNILVSTIGTVNYFRGRHARIRLIAPFLISSIPMAYLGGTVRLPAHLFNILLIVFLAVVALRIYLFNQFSLRWQLRASSKILVSLLIGLILGFISGALGLGGGIYLIPLIILLGLGTVKEAAACGSLFIWVNSAAGLAARLNHQPLPDIGILPLLVCVGIGGYAGSFLGANRFQPRTMQRLLGVIVLIAIVFLLKKTFM